MSHEIHAPRGTTLITKGWHQEAALRMLMNNLDPEVAEKPEKPPEIGKRLMPSLNPLKNWKTMKPYWFSPGSRWGYLKRIPTRRGY